ncbi:MAG: aerial mycelium formation protein [Actinomycetota bacterium]|nr:aerial mycelium formation protein [Actinomycetota bacterium]
MLQDELDRVLASDYLGDLSARSVEEIRSLRAECQRAEGKLSYMRRLVQGRLDIVARELRQRAEGQNPSDLPDLVENLPEILADNVHGARHERLVANLHPPDIDEVTAEIDAKAGTGALGSLSELSDDDLRALHDRLSSFDREVSDQRRALFGRIDSLSAELTRRYKDGEASVETALS